MTLAGLGYLLVRRPQRLMRDDALGERERPGGPEEPAPAVL
ncbi:hypothetical protein ACFQ0M_13920 [Kitasatospora aburaviensis]